MWSQQVIYLLEYCLGVQLNNPDPTPLRFVYLGDVPQLFVVNQERWGGSITSSSHSNGTYSSWTLWGTEAIKFLQEYPILYDDGLEAVVYDALKDFSNFFEVDFIVQDHAQLTLDSRCYFCPLCCRSYASRRALYGHRGAYHNIKGGCQKAFWSRFKKSHRAYKDRPWEL